MKKDTDICLHGGHPWPDHLRLKAGSLSMNYENGNLRYISAGNTEILRMIYFALRDIEWLTIKPEMSDVVHEINTDSFTLKYNARFRSGEINFAAEFQIEGRADNTLIFKFEGEVLSTFRKNRIGLCVLHPAEECAGKSCITEHPDGATEQSFFPEEISPHQIFRNIKSLKWMTGGLNCRLDFEGDIFETEDQRNWSDSSFKTYSTPLSIPFPVQVEKGTVISQKITIHVEGNPETIGDTENITSVMLLPEHIIRLPEVGICQSGRPFPMSATEKKQLRALQYDHYRIDLVLSGREWQARAENGFRDSYDLGWPVMFALIFDDNYRDQLKDFLKWYSWRKPSVRSVIIFHKDHPSTPEKMALEIIPVIREQIQSARIGTGTNANFAEINRNRPADAGNDFISFSVHPQEHAADNYTVTENLIAQKYLVQSAAQLAGNKGICVSPVTLARRFNANVSFFELPGEGKIMPPQVDTRQLSLYGACWTAGSLKYLCESDAESITYFETTGERGIIQGNKASRWPDQFPSSQGDVFPAYFVFRYLLANKDMNVVKSTSSNPRKTECLALTDGRKVRAILVNLTAEVQSVRIRCCSGLFRIRTLHSGNYTEAISKYLWTGKDMEKIIKSDESFPLEPCSVNFIEGWLRQK